VVLLAACNQQAAEREKVDGYSRTDHADSMLKEIPSHYPTVTLGGGCFWCIEAVLESIPGVYQVESGYMGGHVPHPTYEQVCDGNTGHAEVVQFRYDPQQISYEEILDWFWKMHDPTTPNQQGYDIGPQYRSVIFTHSEEQLKAARESAIQLGKAGVYPNPVVTEIGPATQFWRAEEYHQDYFRKNPHAGYCRAVIAPKLHKLKLRQ
jgi:peptide-methionine (S)-S-oxide reductase